MILLRSKFRKNLLLVTGGTALAQLVVVAASPLLTRLYTPAEFGIFALYTSIAMCISNIAGGRYGMALFLPEKESDSLGLALLGLVVGGIVCCLMLALLIGAHLAHARVAYFSDLGRWQYSLPVVVWLMTAYNVYSYWLNRKTEYVTLATMRVSLNFVQQIANVVLVLLLSRRDGLLIGYVLFFLLASAWMALASYLKDKELHHEVNFALMRRLAVRYKRFPLINLPAAAVGNLGVQIPVFVLTSTFGPAASGFYSVAMRMSNAVTSVFSSSIGEVFRQRSADDYQKRGDCRAIWMKTMFSLIAIAIVPTLIFAFFGGPLFAFVFGAKWRLAGVYMQILSPLFFMIFVASPLSMTFYFAEWQHLDLIWQCGLLAVGIVTLLIGSIHKDVMLALEMYSAGSCFMYLIYLAISYRGALGVRREATPGTALMDGNPLSTDIEGLFEPLETAEGQIADS